MSIKPRRLLGFVEKAFPNKILMVDPKLITEVLSSGYTQQSRKGKYTKLVRDYAVDPRLPRNISIMSYEMPENENASISPAYISQETGLLIVNPEKDIRYPIRTIFELKPNERYPRHRTVRQGCYFLVNEGVEVGIERYVSEDYGDSCYATIRFKKPSFTIKGRNVSRMWVTPTGEIFARLVGQKQHECLDPKLLEQLGIGIVITRTGHEIFLNCILVNRNGTSHESEQTKLGIDMIMNTKLPEDYFLRLYGNAIQPVFDYTTELTVTNI